MPLRNVLHRRRRAPPAVARVMPPAIAPSQVHHCRLSQRLQRRLRTAWLARVSTPAHNKVAVFPMLNFRSYKSYARLVACLIAGAVVLPMEGCGLAALPCRLVSATVKIVPGVGNAAAAPFDTCAAAID
ncbi:DUF6726 family protein [Caballeronia mineralivorans]|uniref:DUF6726 family protein n=2 Tax=Caballeronia mineralivorans TaxID=2010198 RepID=UPI002AFF52C4|nr:DUF6726 family protein [Caballeronia mineralivorans]